MEGGSSVCDLLLMIVFPLVVVSWGGQLLSVYFVFNCVMVAEDPGMGKTF